MKNNVPDNIITTVKGTVEKNEHYVADLDQALSVAGVGWYNLKYGLVLSLFLIAAIIEPVGYAYVLPAAKCDLHMTDTQRGFIASIPYIGVVISSFPLGYLVDTQGRKRVVIWSSLLAGLFAMLSGLMPEIISFTVCKFIASMCLSGPAAVPYTFIGEITPPKDRDLILLIVNSLQIFGSAMVPLIAWGVLPADFRINFGIYDFRPWRLLNVVNGCFLVLAAFLMSFGLESPKYLMAQGKQDEALEVLRTIYAGNKGKSPKEYPIQILKMESNAVEGKRSFWMSLKEQTLPLLKAPYNKWLMLNGVLLFGVFATLLVSTGFVASWFGCSGKRRRKHLFRRGYPRAHMIMVVVMTVICWGYVEAAVVEYDDIGDCAPFLITVRLNGLFVWIPDVLNRVWTIDSEGQSITACSIIKARLNETIIITKCDDQIARSTFIINAAGNSACAIIALVGSSTVNIIGKKALLIVLFGVIGIFAILVNFITQDILFTVFLSSFPVMGIGIGPVNAYAVEIFPTQYRGMAISLSLMFGRMGSVVGANLAGALLNVNCPATFYVFGGSLIVCALLVLLLPRTKNPSALEKAIYS